MADSNDTSEPKKLDLSALALPKVSVSTSIGQLFVRRARLSDWGLMDGQTPEGIGRAAVRQLTNRLEAQESHDPLGSEDLEQLQEPDFRVLGEALAKLNAWGSLEEGDALMALGACIETAIGESWDLQRKILADLSESLKRSYSFLGSDALEKLQGQMGDLANLRRSLAKAERTQGALAALDRSKGVDEWLATIVEPISSTAIDLQPLNPVDPADTKLGRATLENARVSQEISQTLTSLVGLVAGLNQTLVKDVLPAWVKQVETDQEAAQQEFQRAATALKWTLATVVLSVCVTIGMTWWQVIVARDIDRGNTELQREYGELIKQQLEAQRQQTELYRQESEKLRATLGEAKSPRNPSSKR
ncbi:MAG: hypothetical protein FIB06_09465 [Betaproteobacteria bacterium]|nr:hypothetical protein [Betaproteobacteria bacterium]